MNEVNRFFSQVKYSANNCWLWIGTLNNKGYGNIQIKNKKIKVHRWVYEYFREPLKSMYCLHACDTPACVNPFHLFAGTLSDNQRDSVKKKRHANTRKTNCIRGHKLSGDNLYTHPTGRRICKICRRKHDLKRYYKAVLEEK